MDKIYFNNEQQYFLFQESSIQFSRRKEDKPLELELEAINRIQIVTSKFDSWSAMSNMLSAVKHLGSSSSVESEPVRIKIELKNKAIQFFTIYNNSSKIKKAFLLYNNRCNVIVE